MSTEAEKLRALIERYWQIAYTEGKEGRDHDTENGDAYKTWATIEAIISGNHADATDIVLTPSDLLIEAWPSKIGGMHFGMPRGVKIMHVPGRVLAACDSERSQHRNRDLAMQGIRAMLAAKVEG